MGERARSAASLRQHLADLAARAGVTLTEQELAALAPVYRAYRDGLERLGQSLSLDDEPAVIFERPVGRQTP